MSADPMAAVVTGASGSIGGAVLLELARQGVHSVGIHHRNGVRAKAAAERTEQETGIRTELLGADLTDPDDVAALPDRAAALLGSDAGILVCAHGAAARGSVLAPVDSARLWAVNVAATERVAAAFARPMMRARAGRVVVVGSRAGVVGMPGQAGYATSKAALSGWAGSAAGELGRFGITVNVVAPGALDADPDGDALTYDAAARAAVIERIALRRLGTAADVAAVVAFLAGHAASYVSGQTLLVDGGARW